MTIQKSLSEITWNTHSLQSDKPYRVQIRTVRYYQRLVCYDSAVIKKNLRSHLIVECLLALEMLLPVTADERLFPPWRSSIDRFQGLDLSTVFSVLFSELSPSYLSNAQQQGLRNNIILFFCCCFFFVHPPKTYFICGHGTFAYVHCKNYNPNPKHVLILS